MASAPSPSSSLLAAASPPSTSTPSSPAPMASRPNATPADSSTTPPASSPAAPSPPTPPPPATATPPVVAPPKPSPSPPPPHVSAPAPARHPPPNAAAPPVVHSPPPTSATPPKSSPSHPRPPSPRPPAAPTGSPPLASPPSGHPTNHSPPSVVTSAPRSPRPSLPTPATAADPARQSSTKSSSPGVRHRSSSSDGGLSTGAMVIIGAVLAILVLSLVGAAVWYTKKRKRARDGYHAGFMISSPFMSLHPSGDSSSARFPFAPAVQTSYSNGSPRLKEPIQTNYSTGSPRLKESLSDLSMANSRFFTYEELYQITNGFSTQNLLGEGGFGSVYKGCLRDGRVVAIKRLKDGGGQGEREFHAEVEIISRVHHRHLVSLVGYCISDDQRLLVYDFVPNNTLHYHLHGHGRPVLEWPARVKIAAGAARGIAYLHEDCHPRIIHRDIKSSNILLDNNFEAQVADFGLARLALDAVTHVTTRVMGTFGYLAPEYASSGKLTERSDVFSFGVVLLELITGRKPVDASRPLGDESLVEWARPLLTQAIETGDLEELLDARLKNFNEVEMFRMIEAAAACIRHSASRRPRMSQVVRVLDSLADIDLTNGVQPGKSELFNVANTADIRLFQQMVLFGSQDHSSDFSQSSWNSRGRDIGSASGSRLL